MNSIERNNQLVIGTKSDRRMEWPSKRESEAANERIQLWRQTVSDKWVAPVVDESRSDEWAAAAHIPVTPPEHDRQTTNMNNIYRPN